MSIRNNKVKTPDPYLWLVLLIHRQPVDVPTHDKCQVFEMRYIV